MHRSAENAFGGTITNYDTYIFGDLTQEEAPKSLPKEEIKLHFMDRFRLRDLNALGSTCKLMKQYKDEQMQERLKKAVAAGSEIHELKKETTENLLSKVYLECENHYARINIPKAIKMVDIIFKRQCRHQDIEEPILIKTLLKKAEILTAAPNPIEERIETVNDICSEVLKYETASREQKALANYLRVKAGYLIPYEDDTDQDLFNRMIVAHENPDLPKSYRIEAEMLACIMVLSERAEDPFYTKALAMVALEKIILNKDATIEQQAQSMFWLAEEFRNQMTEETDQKAAKLYYLIVNDFDISEKIRMKAAFNLVEMRYEHRTTLINDAKAIKYLKELKDNEETDDEIQGLVDFYLPLFRYENRATEEEVSNEDAFTFLVNVENNHLIDDFIKYEASLYQVIMWYEGRTDQMTYDEAMEKLDEILDDPGIIPCRMKATLYKAKILYKYEKNDAKALELFDLVATKESAEEKDRELAAGYRNLMISCGRGA